MKTKLMFALVAVSAALNISMGVTLVHQSHSLKLALKDAHDTWAVYNVCLGMEATKLERQMAADQEELDQPESN